MYENRIIETKEVDPKEITPNKYNWRRHPKHQSETMDETLKEIGWIQDVIINKSTGNLIDGHLRLDLALKNREPKIPVKYVNLTEEEERKALLTFDPINSMAETNRNMLDELITSLKEDIEQPISEEISSINTTISKKEPILKIIEEAEIATGIKKYDPVETEWQNMPEFKMEDKTEEHKLIVNFERTDDLFNFSKVIGQEITPNTRSIWYPKKEKRDIMSMGYVSEEE